MANFYACETWDYLPSLEMMGYMKIHIEEDHCGLCEQFGFASLAWMNNGKEFPACRLFDSEISIGGICPAFNPISFEDFVTQ